MWTLVPTRDLIRRAVHRPRREVKELATKSWQIAPAERTIPPRAHFLPDQLERVTGHEFASDSYRRDMYGGIEVEHAATRGYLIQNVLLVDGTLYKDDASTHLVQSRNQLPPISVRRELDRGAIFCTPGGNRYFGQWLIDDCVTYPMAAAEGQPVTTAQPPSAHAAVYEQLFDMRPQRVQATRIRELVLFDDFGQNCHKSGRYRSLTEKLVSKFGATTHPGVFVLRGGSGAKRLLKNELALAEYLAARRGFRVVDPMATDVPTILSTCAGAEVVVGVEGSHLVHALLTLTEGKALLLIMPPFRFCTVLKDVADRERIKFGFVVGQPVDDGFVASATELERTLDLMEN